MTNKLALLKVVAFGLLFGTAVMGQNKSVLLMNGTAHLGNGKVIENSVIEIKDGKIVSVAGVKAFAKINPEDYDTIIQLAGKQVYPGIIAPNSTVGLIEMEAVRATSDFAEVGLMNPNVRSETSYNTESVIIPTLRTNGVLIVQACPRGERIPGTSSVFNLYGWNWEDALLKGDDGVELNFPRWPVEQLPVSEAPAPVIDRRQLYEKQVQELRKFFKDARAYAEVDHPEEKNLRFEAMKGVFSGSERLYIHADYAKDIVAALGFVKEFQIKSAVLVGAKDAWLLTGMIKESGVPVMLGRVHDLPAREDDDKEIPYKLPGILQKAGILFCLQNQGDMEAMNARNLPFQAGTAAAYGLTKEEALMAITGNSAKILGIADRVGTLETGKDATLFISAGDALDMRTNKPELVFIQGRMMGANADNVQRVLYEKYCRKYNIAISQ